MSELPPSDASAAPASARRERLVELALLAVLGVVLALLEWRHPYYFLQDDNRTAQLGLFAHGTRALLAGELPLYNAHQFLGMPSFAVGSVAFLYPPVYAAVLASQGLFGHPDAAIDLLVALHLAVGLVGMSRLLRGLGVSRAGAAFGALTWPLSSMVIYTADSWWNVVGVVAYLPWILHFALRTVRGEGGRGTFVALVGARALLLYLGQVQLFVYAVCFELLCVLLAVPAAAGGDRRPMQRRLGRYALGLYISAALALPLVEPLWEHAARSQDRAATLDRGAFAEGGYDVVAWLRGTVDPYVDNPLPGTPVEYSLDRLFFFLSFTGHATLLLLAWLHVRGSHALRVPARAFAVPFAVAFLWTAGTLDRLLYLLPVVNRFRWPFRVNLFVVFFLVVLAASALPAVVAACSRRWGVRAAQVVAALVLSVQVGELADLYLRHPQRSYNFLPHRERPPLVEPLAAQLANGRVVSLGLHDRDPYGSAQLAYDYASLWGLYQYSGYANLLSARQLRHVPGLRNAELHRPSHDGVFRPHDVPFAYFRDWGIAWYVVGRNDSTPEETTFFRRLLAAQGMRLVAEDARRIVFHDPRALPLAAVVGNPAPIALRTGGGSLEARLPPSDRPRQLRLCFLHLAGMTARADDGRPLRLLADPLERILVEVPAGVEGVRVVYREPALARGVRDAALLFALPLLVWLPIRLRRRKAPR